MKQFLKKTFIYANIILFAHIVAAFFADGHTDPFYVRFTTPQQGSLIIGTSRAAQGLQPEVINRELQLDHSRKLFNFSFTMVHSPYGKVYYDAIRKKLNPDSKNGVFILSVDPWSISSRSDDPDDETSFVENTLALSNTYFMNINPNIEYLIHNYHKSWGRLCYNKFRNKSSEIFLHDDGWLEVNVSMSTKEIAKRTDKKIKTYRETNLPLYSYSSVRFDYLEKTVSLLKQHGDVYLVRLPIHEKMVDIENEFMPNFDSMMNVLAKKQRISYFNFIDCGSKYVFTDGNHLHKDSGKAISIDIANLIKKVKTG